MQPGQCLHAAVILGIASDCSGWYIGDQQAFELVNLVFKQKFSFLEAMNQQLVLVRQGGAHQMFDDQIEITVFYLKLVQGRT